MAAVSLEIDLSGFALADLRVLRLGAQIMGHRASLAARPEVGAFFAQLEGQLALELRRGADAARQARPMTLTIGEVLAAARQSRIAGSSPNTSTSWLTTSHCRRRCAARVPR